MSEFHNAGRASAVSSDAPDFFRGRHGRTPVVRALHAGSRFDWSAQAGAWRAPFGLPQAYLVDARVRGARAMTLR